MQHHENQRPGIVIGAIAVLEMWNRKGGMLKNPRTVRQTQQMIIFRNGQIAFAVPVFALLRRGDQDGEAAAVHVRSN